ncbi:MAG: RNase adaptor protein RapZ, partial [Desulfovibrio sp.]|nr:RNase adaptor protein RapZ [Desulfovibrio sp.]
MSQKLLYVVTGLSGAGKSTALRAFEDLGFFTVDGLPASLAPDMAAMLEKPAMRHFVGMAMGMDLRDRDFLASFNSILAEL